MFTGFFETVIHDMPKSQSRQYIKELRKFYTAGWIKIMGLTLNYLKEVYMKKPSNLLKLLDYAGNFRYFTIASWILSALSALLALIPFWYIWRIIKEAIETAPNFSGAGNMVHNGWMAVIFAIIAVLIYISALMCSHVAAFRIASNIRVKAMHHILNLPVGEIELMIKPALLPRP